MTTKKGIPLDLEQNPIQALIGLIEILRGKAGCPWDREQTPQSISVYLTEEIFELADAIAADKTQDICEELGDVLFQVFFIADMFKENGSFDISAVASQIIEKMVRRHPHVFGPDKVDNTDQIRDRWHQIKQQEKADQIEKSALDSVPVKLPGLMRAYRVSERAARTGFDWQDTPGVIEKVEEEWSELKSAIAERDGGQAADEFGDLLFTLVNLARFLKIHPETSLSDATSKFVRRFNSMEKLADALGQRVDTLSHTQLDALWEEVKGRENDHGSESDS